jgi:hypothetical protein
MECKRFVIRFLKNGDLIGMWFVVLISQLRHFVSSSASTQF